ncbi:cytochrome P450 [Mycobacterium montefiorense]|uniref:cytochrome P450 n=1 Tax=Mycobacterium montefiorense TaxID=154654 RepID=UPI0021DECD34|nr:cytochrome P450 [Mycobacterium montefiorense]GLE52192.1 cytochrome P450 [Mycobacterium montefiorense]
MTATPGTQPSSVSDIDPFSDEFLTDPYPGYQKLRASGHSIWLSSYGIWALARHDSVAEALKNPDAFCSSSGVGLADLRKEEPWRPPSLLLEADDPDHAKARRVVTRVLTPSVVRKLKSDFLDSARGMVDKLLTRGRFDVMTDLAQAFVLQVFPDLVGLPQSGREHLIAHGALVFNGLGPRNRHFERAMANAGEVSAWIAAQCTRDHLAPGGLGAQIHDLASVEGYSEDDANRIVRSLLSAGVDTTVFGIGNAVHCLAQRPEQWNLLCANPSLARSAFEETLRFDSPAQAFFRTTTCDVEIGGVSISVGTKILLLVGAANRDPRRWDEPEKFDVMRNAAGHLSFGVGIHGCVGQVLARLEAESVLTALAERVNTIEISGSAVRQLNNGVRGFESLPVAVTAR